MSFNNFQVYSILLSTMFMLCNKSPEFIPLP